MSDHLPSSLEAHLGFWLRYVSNHVSSRFEKLLAEHQISVTEWVALRALFDQPGTSHAALIEALGMTKGAASKVISRLESKGLAERRALEDSARGQALALTAAGQALVPILAACADENDAHFFGHLPAERRAELMALCKELVRHHQLKTVPTE